MAIRRFVPPIKTAIKGPVGRPRKGVSVSRAGANKSLRDASANLDAFAKHLTDQSAPILFQGLIDTFRKARDIYCPTSAGKIAYAGSERRGRKGGDLRRSGYLEKVTSGKRTTIQIGFGKTFKGILVDYAGFVHERLDLHHDSPTRAKFLQSAMDEDLPEIRAKVAQALAFAGGVSGATSPSNPGDV